MIVRYLRVDRDRTVAPAEDAVQQSLRDDQRPVGDQGRARAQRPVRLKLHQAPLRPALAATSATSAL